MNWDEIQGKWKQSKGRIREKWGLLTDHDLDAIQGRRDQLIGRLQEVYGISREEAHRQVEEFLSGHRETRRTTGGGA
jgi:uncharacterized protein YjbJ (UPF0337 family)